MRKVFTLLALGMSLVISAQKEKAMGLSVGLAQNGGFNVGFNVKHIKNNVGMYVHLRGLQAAIHTETGVDYSGISDTYITRTEYGDKQYFGGVLGGLYSFGQSNFTLGMGLGVAAESVQVTDYYIHDFVYIDDERRTVMTSEERTRFSAEVMADYKFSKKRSGLGIQAGYNIVHGGFGLLYYDF